MTRPAPRTVRLLTLVTGLFLLILGPMAGTAAAHSTVVGSDPADGSSVDTGPQRATITFNEPLQPEFPAMTVVGPDGNLWSQGEPIVEGKDLSVAVNELGPAGVYRVAYRVTSADGHVVSGERSFTLAVPGSGNPGPPANGTDSGDTGGGIPVWIYIAGAVVLFGGGLAFALFGPSGSKGNNQR